MTASSSSGSGDYLEQIRAAAMAFIVRPDRLVAGTVRVYVMEMAVLLRDDTGIRAFINAVQAAGGGFRGSEGQSLRADAVAMTRAVAAELAARRSTAYHDSMAQAPRQEGDAINRIMPFNVASPAPADRMSIVLPPSIDSVRTILWRIFKASHDAGVQIVTNGVALFANVRQSTLAGGMNSYRFALLERGEDIVSTMLLSECIFSRETNESLNGVNPPADLTTKLYILMVDQAPQLRIKTAVPWLDGTTIVATPGYHPRGVWYEPADSAPFNWPTNPTEEEMKAAVRQVRRIYVEPFKPDDEVKDCAAIMGTALMTIVGPGCRGRVPAVVINKPIQNSGGTTLATFFAMTATGEVQSRAVWPRNNQEEQHKVLLTLLRRGRAALLFDNVKGTLEGESAAIATEATFMEGRILGTMTEARFPINALILFSGNGVTVDRDLYRRLLFINLAGFMDDAERRRLRAGSTTDQAWIDSLRRPAIEALLTMIQWWIVRGAVRGADTIDSFVDVTAVVGGILESCGVAGWPGVRDDTDVLSDREEGDDRFVRDLWEVFGIDQFTAGDVVDRLVDQAMPLPINTRDNPNREQRIIRLGFALKRVAKAWRVVVERDGLFVPEVRARIMQTRTRAGRYWGFERAIPQSEP